MTRPRQPQAKIERKVAEAAVASADKFVGSALFMPPINPIVLSVGTTNGSALRKKGYAQLLEEYAGLEVVHNGLVAVTPADTAPAPDLVDIEVAALRLPAEELAGLIGRLTSHIGEVRSADPQA